MVRTKLNATQSCADAKGDMKMKATTKKSKKTNKPGVALILLLSLTVILTIVILSTLAKAQPTGITINSNISVTAENNKGEQYKFIIGSKSSPLYLIGALPVFVNSGKKHNTCIGTIDCRDKSFIVSQSIRHNKDMFKIINIAKWMFLQIFNQKEIPQGYKVFIT